MKGKNCSIQPQLTMDLINCQLMRLPRKGAMANTTVAVGWWGISEMAFQLI